MCKTIKKYLCSYKDTDTGKQQLLLRQSLQTNSGWITKNNNWIPVQTFHSHPDYLKLLDSNIDIKSSIDAELFLRFKTRNVKFYDELALLVYECIHKGAIRVIERNEILYLDANSIERAQKGLKVLFSNCINSFRSIILNILDKNGNKIETAEFSAEDNKFKRTLTTPLMFDPNDYL